MSSFILIATPDPDCEEPVADDAYQEAVLSAARAVGGAGHALHLLGASEGDRELVAIEAQSYELAIEAPLVDVHSAPADTVGVFVAGNVSDADLDAALSSGLPVGCLTSSMPARLAARADVQATALDELGDYFAYPFLLQSAVEEWACGSGLSAADIRALA